MMGATHGGERTVLASLQFHGFDRKREVDKVLDQVEALMAEESGYSEKLIHSKQSECQRLPQKPFVFRGGHGAKDCCSGSD
ncbi:hypothetical protein JOB18_024352 [Solea senegalensis]|uniref:Uncharacterized protein n=1 Tax=Solea senegalensis TaxID=28829 RepID=A0AAV6SI14_SOLSE|nr:hypothetical protein JOB18_024352 [Solea senegalensis]